MRFKLDPLSPSGVSIEQPKEAVRNSNGYVGTRKLRELDEVAITGTPTNGHALVYNSTSGKWEPAAVSGGTGGTNATNLTATRTATAVTVASDTGTDATIAASDSSNAGVMSAADKTKLDGVATGATANSSDATLLARANHTGTQVAATISDLTEAVQDTIGTSVVAGTNVTVTYDDVAGTTTIAASGAGGTNATNLSATTTTTAVTVLSDTGTDAAIAAATSTAAGVMTSADRTKLDGIATGATANATDAQLRDRSTHTGTQAAGTITGLATVATSGSYNDLTNKPDLTALNEIETYATTAIFPATGTSDRVYIAEDTGYMYRWNGSGYTQLTDQTAVWGQVAGTLANQTDLQTALNAKEATITAGTTAQYYRGDKTFQTLDKAAVGLANVDNTSDATKNSATATLTNKTFSDYVQVQGSSSAPAAPAAGLGKFAMAGTSSVRPRFINVSGTVETVLTDSYSTWTAWTPTFTNLTIGNGTIDAKYVRIAGTIVFRCRVTLGSTSSIGGSVTFSLPVTAVNIGTESPIGQAIYIDTGTGQTVGGVEFSSTTTGVLILHAASTSYITRAALSATAPHSWASTDILRFNGTYEAA